VAEGDKKLSVFETEFPAERITFEIWFLSVLSLIISVIAAAVAIKASLSLAKR